MKNLRTLALPIAALVAVVQSVSAQTVLISTDLDNNTIDGGTATVPALSYTVDDYNSLNVSIVRCEWDKNCKSKDEITKFLEDKKRIAVLYNN